MATMRGVRKNEKKYLGIYPTVLNVTDLQIQDGQITSPLYININQSIVLVTEDVAKL